MPEWVTITLPYNTPVIVQCFANAANTQRVSVRPSIGTPWAFQGTGFYDTSLGMQPLNTGSGSGAGFDVDVAVDHSTDKGQTWQPSQVDTDDCQIMYFNMVIVVSEDSGDDTWDDATTYFTWTAPPPSEAAPTPAKHWPGIEAPGDMSRA
jgi:hypothetical protein